MAAQHNPHYSRFFFGSVFLILAVLTFFIVRPFISALLGAGAIAYIFFPVYRKVTAVVRNRFISALLVSLLVVIIITVPLVLLIDNITSEASYIYLRTQQKLATGEITGVQCAEGEKGIVCAVAGALDKVFANSDLRIYMVDLFRKVAKFFSDRASELIFSVPRFLLNIFITIFTSFYLFLDGPGLVQRLRRLTPLKPSHQEAVFKQVDDVVYALIFGSIITALIQGGLGALGFWIFKAPSPVLWGIITAIAALIPVVGTGIVWLPIALVQIANGYVTGQASLMFDGIGLLIFGTLIISQIDNLLRPLLIGNRANVHPVLILLGALGGLAVFGLIGFIIGPLVLALLKTFFQLYEQEREPGHSHHG